MKDKFRLLVDGYSSGSANMARDETLLRRVIAGESPPCLRFYQWKPAALSLGRFQEIAQGVDLDQCRKHGIDRVRRLTGGQGVLHDDELTYSIIIPVDHQRFEGRGVLDSYRTISEALTGALRDIGIDCSMAGEQTTRADPMGDGVCFYTPTAYEVVVNGKKIIGSAQTRERGVILQHGSVPIDWDIEKQLDVMGIHGEHREAFGGILMQRATTVAEQLGKRAEFEKLVPGFVRGFENVFDMKAESSDYTVQERKLVEWLMENRYGNDEWNLKK